MAERRVLFFMMTTVNGYYERAPWDIEWHNTDAEFNDFAIQQLGTVDTLLFGRKTYEGMARYWPTREALESDPIVAGRMNSLPKIVFSRSLATAAWENTTIARGEASEQLAAIKRQPGGDMLLMGSSDLAASLSARALIDEYRIMINPIALADGRPVLTGLAADVKLALADTRVFSSGNVLLTYRRAAS
jgi:dihydrofolate reductase